MSMKTDKIVSFLENVADPNNPSSDERQMAWDLLVEIMKQKNITVSQESDICEAESATEKLSLTKARIKEIKHGLMLSRKSGLASKSIH